MFFLVVISLFTIKNFPTFHGQKFIRSTYARQTRVVIWSQSLIIVADVFIVYDIGVLNV